MFLTLQQGTGADEQFDSEFTLYLLSDNGVKKSEK